MHDNVHIVYCDIADLKSLKEKIGTECDIFYHFAWTGTDKPANRMNMYIQTDNIRYVLGNGKTITLKECVETICREIGSNIEIGYGDIPYYEDQVMYLQADVSRLTEDTGWKPTTDFVAGIRKLIENYRR